MIKCKKCGMLKIDDKSKCACNVKKFDEKKLSKKTKEEKKPKSIKQVSDKKAKERKERGSLMDFYSKLAKKHFDENGDGKCEYCGGEFNIEHDLLDNRVAFAHILAKGNPLYKHLAVFPNNVAIVCSEKCHTNMDQEICKLKLKTTLKLLIESGKKIQVSDLQQYL